MPRSPGVQAVEVDINMEDPLMDHLIKASGIVEIDRLELDSPTLRILKDAGVKIAISTDAHSAEGLDMMRFGVDQARRGWLEAKDVVNTRTWPDLKNIFRR